jgi:hypothetical protein
MARLRGQVETAEAPAVELELGGIQGKIHATVKAMRESGAPEADIEAFLKEQAA